MSKAFVEWFNRSRYFNLSNPLAMEAGKDGWNAAIAHAVKVLRDEAEGELPAGYSGGLGGDSRLSAAFDRIADRLERGE